MSFSEAQLTNYYVNLMVMNYGEALPRNCVVIGGRCDMGKSRRPGSAQFQCSLRRAVRPHGIDADDWCQRRDHANVFTLDDAVTLARFVRNEGLAGVHFWSLDRDGSCSDDAAVVSATCSGLRGLAPLAFTRAFSRRAGAIGSVEGNRFPFSVAVWLTRNAFICLESSGEISPSTPRTCSGM